MAALTVNREDQARIKSLLTEAVTVLCRNGLSYSSHVAIDGLLGITVDDRDVFLVKLTETVSHSDSSPEFSHVNELLGAAQNNFGLSLNADGSSPLPMQRFGGKDVNDNHTSTPAAINIAPIGDGVLSAHRGGKRGRGSSGHAGDQPSAKRTHVSDSPLTTPTSGPSGGVGRIGEDAGGNLVIKTEPIDYDEENAVPQQYTGKTLGVISTVNTDNFNDSADDSYQGDQPESQDGVLQALRAALIHKLANNGTPMMQKHNNNNDSPSPTPSNNNNNNGGSIKKRKGTPKNENQESEVTLKCLMCTYETNRRYNFIRHMRGHSKSYAIYACDLCGERFHSEDELGNHGLEAHKGHHLTCDQCGMTFMSERGKNIHAKTHKMMPIPEKKSVECETQCSQNDLEESMLNISSGSKVITSTGVTNEEAAAKYRTLREQLSSRSLVIRFPVLNGRVQTAVLDGATQDDGEQSQEEDDQPADLSMSKSCSTSTSPPPPFEPKEETSPVTLTTVSSTATTTKSSAGTTTTSSTVTTTKSPAVTTTKSPAVTTTKSPAVTTTKSPAVTTIKSPAVTTTKSPAVTTTKSPAVTTTKSPAGTTTKSPAGTTTKSPAGTTTKFPAGTTIKSPAATTTKSPAATTTKTPTATIIKPSTTPTDLSMSTTKPAPHTPKVASSVMNLSLPSSTIPCTTSTSRVLPTSALSAALANAAKAKSILISPSSGSVSPTPSTSSATEGESKPKSRKQHSAQIVRLVTVKKEPNDA